MSSEAPPTETAEELSSRHKKEIKALDGEKRAALKNAKSMGKKAKAKIKEVEFKYEGLERDMKDRHRMEFEALNNGSGGEEEAAEDDVPPDSKETIETEESSKQVTFDTVTNTHQSNLEQEQNEQQAAELKRQKALQKKLKKKNAQKQKELDREQRIADENASAGPSPRIVEIQSMIALYLNPHQLRIQDVEADGNCLYRAVGKQAQRLGLLSESLASYDNIRDLCANTLLSERNEYEPFAELDHDPNHPAENFEEYVNNVRFTSTWGGQLELRALSHGLKVPVVVFSAEGPPLVMGQEYEDATAGGETEEEYGKKKAVLVSFHRHYYALGEHYNSVVPMDGDS